MWTALSGAGEVRSAKVAFQAYHKDSAIADILVRADYSQQVNLGSRMSLLTAASITVAN